MRKGTQSASASTPQAVCMFTVPLPIWVCPAGAWERRSRVSTTTTADRNVKTITTSSGFTVDQSALEAGLTLGPSARQVGVEVLLLLREPLEKGVHLRHAVATEREGETDPAQVVGGDRAVRRHQGIGGVVVRRLHGRATTGGDDRDAAERQHDQDREEPHHGGACRSREA